MTVRAIQSNPSVDNSLVPHWEAFCINRKQIDQTVLEKIAKFDLSDLLK